MKKFLAVLILNALVLALGALPGAARPDAGGAVVLPVSLQGTYQPIQSDQFTSQLLAILQKAGRGQDIVRISNADLQAAGFQTPNMPPSTGVAQGLCNQTGKRYCIWLSLRLDATMGAAGDHLAMAGVTRFWGYDSKTGTVVIDSPLSSLHSLPVGPKPTPAALQQATQKLVNQNVQDLALQMMTLADQETAAQRVRSWQAAGQAAQAAAPSGPNPNVQAMEQACRNYSSAVRQSDLIATQDAQKRAYTAWPLLNAQEQKQVEQDYPGTTLWMSGGSWYGGGYYYPPYVPVNY